MFNKLRRWAKFNSPSSATLSGWKNHYSRYKKDAPIRYFFFHTVPRLYRRNVVFKIHHAILWVKYRFHPRHRYHVVRTVLPYGYHESDDRMIYAVFALICDYVEIELSAIQGSKKYRDKEAGIERLNHLADYNRDLPPTTPIYERLSVAEEKFYSELRILYTWWYEEFLTFEGKLAELSKRYPLVRDLDNWHSDADDRPLLSTVIIREWSEKRQDLVNQHETRADAMLLRACKIRHFLWT